MDELPPLRGLGPRVFLSYSFRDFEFADHLATYLRREGMQVQMEDETSLLGSSLSHTLQSRIAGAEVFLQVLTATSAKSSWVAREFSWAIEPGAGGGKPHVVLPIVVGDIEVPAPVADWAYLPSPALPDDKLLDVVRRTAMRSVAVLPVDADRPYQFTESDLVAYCSSPASSDLRLIVDPVGLIPGLIRRSIVHFVEAPSVQKQQRRAYDRFLRRLGVLDAYVAEFVRRVRPMAVENWGSEEWPRQLAGIVQRLVRLTIGPVVVDLVTTWTEAVRGSATPAAVAHCKAALEQAKALQAGAPSLVGAGRTFWALDGSAGQRWLDLGFDGKPGIADAYLFLPADHFDEIGVLSLTAGIDAPAAEVTTTDWLTIGLPQVAAEQMPRHASDVAAAAEHTGWSIGDYRRTGKH